MLHSLLEDDLRSGGDDLVRLALGLTTLELLSPRPVVRPRHLLLGQTHGLTDPDDDPVALSKARLKRVNSRAVVRSVSEV